MSNRWSNQSRGAMSSRVVPTAEQATAFQARAIIRDLRMQRGTDQTATIGRVLAILAAEYRRRRAGAQGQPSALWCAMGCYGITEADVRRAAR
mgnify:CR=1 FL=1